MIFSALAVRACLQWAAKQLGPKAADQLLWGAQLLDADVRVEAHIQEAEHGRNYYCHVSVLLAPKPEVDLQDQSGLLAKVPAGGSKLSGSGRQLKCRCRSVRRWAMHKQEMALHLCASEICDGDRHLSPAIWDLQAEEDCRDKLYAHQVAWHKTMEVHLECVRRDFTPANSMAACNARPLI